MMSIQSLVATDVPAAGISRNEEACRSQIHPKTEEAGAEEHRQTDECRHPQVPEPSSGQRQGLGKTGPEPRLSTGVGVVTDCDKT